MPSLLRNRTAYRSASSSKRREYFISVSKVGKVAGMLVTARAREQSVNCLIVCCRSEQPRSSSQREIEFERFADFSAGGVDPLLLSGDVVLEAAWSHKGHLLKAVTRHAHARPRDEEA